MFSNTTSNFRIRVNRLISIKIEPNVLSKIPLGPDRHYRNCLSRNEPTPIEWWPIESPPNTPNHAVTCTQMTSIRTLKDKRQTVVIGVTAGQIVHDPSGRRETRCAESNRATATTAGSIYH